MPRRALGFLVVGGSTAVDVAGLRFVVDPTFDPPTDYGALRKTRGPAVAAQVLGAPHVVVAHQTGWEHFTDGPGATLRAFRETGTPEGDWSRHTGV